MAMKTLHDGIYVNTLVNKYNKNRINNTALCRDLNVIKAYKHIPCPLNMKNPAIMLLRSSKAIEIRLSISLSDWVS